MVEKRAGAGGNRGADLVAKATPDGYTLLMGTVGTHGINKALYRKLAYDPQKDFAPISLVAGVPNVMVVNAEKARAAGIQITEIADKKPFQAAVKPVWDKYGPKYADMIKRIQAVQ